MAYATVDELADALRVQVTAKNSDKLASCLEAAWREIEHGRGSPVGSPPLTGADLALARQINLARGVEWFKANDAAFGVLGFADTGALHVTPDGFARHLRALTPLVESFGLA